MKKFIMTVICLLAFMTSTGCSTVDTIRSIAEARDEIGPEYCKKSPTARMAIRSKVNNKIDISEKCETTIRVDCMAEEPAIIIQSKCGW